MPTCATVRHRRRPADSHATRPSPFRPARPGCRLASAAGWSVRRRRDRARLEQHALADFSVGRDIGLGLGQSQIKAGLRIAELFSKTNGSANFAVPSFYSVPGGVFLGARGASINVQQQSRFTGGGPRAALEGSIPIGGGFAVDYLGGRCGAVRRPLVRPHDIGAWTGIWVRQHGRVGQYERVQSRGAGGPVLLVLTCHEAKRKLPLRWLLGRAEDVEQRGEHHQYGPVLLRADGATDLDQCWIQQISTATAQPSSAGRRTAAR